MFKNRFKIVGFSLCILGLGFVVLGLYFIDFVQGFVLLVTGSVMGVVAAQYLKIGWDRQKKEPRLRMQGQLIQAQVIKVERDLDFESHEVNPYYIIAQWRDPMGESVYTFKSDYIWCDPHRYIKKNKVPVYIDANDPRDYFVDISGFTETQT